MWRNWNSHAFFIGIKNGAASVAIPNSQKVKNPSVHQQRNGYKMWYIHIMEHYLALKKNGKKKWNFDICYNMDRP